MDKTRMQIFGKSLRREFRVPDDLPFPMRKALEALAAQGDEEPEHETCQCDGAKPQEPRKRAE